MELNNKVLADLAAQLGMTSNSQGQGGINISQDKINEFKGKSEDEILQEILKFKNKLKGDRATFEKQLNAIKTLRPMMKGEQKERFDKLIDILES